MAPIQKKIYGNLLLERVSIHDHWKHDQRLLRAKGGHRRRHNDRKSKEGRL